MIILWAASLGAPQARADLETGGSATLATEVDTNARRLAADPETKQRGDGADGLLRGHVAAFGQGQVGAGTFRVDTALGTKLFWRERSERMAVGQIIALVDHPLALGLRSRVVTTMKARTQVSGARTYVLQRTEATLARALPFGFFARGGVIGQSFISIDSGLFSSAGPGVIASVLYFPTSREQLVLTGAARLSAFPRIAADPADPSIPRLDAPVTATVAVVSARAVFVSAGYRLTRNFSNTRGESYTRHRIYAMLGTRLPAEVTVTGQAALQITQYDDGLSIGQRLLLADDDESQNNLSVLISRPWFWGVHTEARFAWFGNEFAKERLGFSRITASAGLRIDL